MKSGLVSRRAMGCSCGGGYNGTDCSLLTLTAGRATLPD
jgi:hypothetical protein